MRPRLVVYGIVVLLAVTLALGTRWGHSRTLAAAEVAFGIFVVFALGYGRGLIEGRRQGFSDGKVMGRLEAVRDSTGHVEIVNGGGSNV